MKMSSLQNAVRVALLALAAAGIAGAAEPWPTRTVRFIVPFGTGSAPDVSARLYAERLASRWHQPVVVENRPGAEGAVGAKAFTSLHDDHALLFSPAAPISVFPLTQDSLGYDASRDFVPITLAVDTVGAVAVSASLNVTSLAGFVTRARAQPGQINWSSGGGAFPIVLAGFAKARGLELVHVGYREQGAALQDLAEGRIQLFATTLTALLPLVQTGKVRLLAVTGSRRAPMAPGLLTAAESGYPELEFEGLVGLFGGRDMPSSVRDKIASDVRAVAAEGVMAERLSAAAQVPRAGTPTEFAKAIEEQRSRMAAIVQRIGRRGP